MVVSKKPKRNEVAASPSALSEEETEALIHKGGSIAQPVAAAPSKKISYISLRIPALLLERIDQQVARMTTPNRHAWLLEAAAQRVKRDEEA